MVPTSKAGTREGKIMATLKNWMQSHDGQKVHTIQYSSESGQYWTPASRVVDASHASYVTFNGSRRDYKGMKVVESGVGYVFVQSENENILYISGGMANVPMSLPTPEFPGITHQALHNALRKLAS